MVEPLAEPILARNLYVSKMLSKPLNEFQWVVDNTNGWENLDADNGDLYSLEPRFMLDSGHDWTVS